MHIDMNNAENTIAKLSETAIRRYEMIQENDRILVGISGGKDSTILVRDLAIKKRWWPVNYKLFALHIKSDVGQQPDISYLTSLLCELGIEYESLTVPVIGRLKPGRKMNCWWCSTQRRTELIRYAMANGFTKICLGHHLDDIVETLLMNMLHKGQFATMPPVVKYDKYPLTIIRPLALCEEKQIIECATDLGLISSVCTCGFDGASRRKETRKKITQLTDHSSVLKRNLFASMSDVRKEYLA